MFKGVERWDLILMFVLIGAMMAFEILGLLSPRMVTVTQVVKNLIPMPVRIMLLSWLVWHLCVSDIIRQITPKT